jgi:hypothetical protein
MIVTPERSNVGANQQRQYWHDIGNQFRLRMDNLRTHHLLEFTKRVARNKQLNQAPKLPEKKGEFLWISILL